MNHKALQEPRSTYEVIEDWTASYPDPIQVRAGEALELDGQKEIWDGHTWLWAKSPAGKEGWIPDSLISPDNPNVAREDYTAVELSCQRGQTLSAETATHGWIFCHADDGRYGWVPERNLSPIDGSDR